MDIQSATGSALGNAVRGLQKAQEQFNGSAEAIAQGDISADSIVLSKEAELAVKVQIANVRSMMEVEEEALNLLA